MNFEVQGSCSSLLDQTHCVSVPAQLDVQVPTPSQQDKLDVLAYI